MSNLSERWYCRECKREWQPWNIYSANSSPESITGNPLNGDNCPICGSPEIELIRFKPPVPGLDIPRDENLSPLPELDRVTPPNIASIPGLTAKTSHTVRGIASEVPFVQVAAEDIKKQIEEDNKDYVPIDYSQMI